MQSLKSDFERETERLIESDVSNYLWLVRFFTGYHYLSQQMQTSESVCSKKWIWAMNVYETYPKQADPEEPVDVYLVSSTMDLLSFKSLFVKCENSLKGKKWALLDLSVGAITEMVLYLGAEETKFYIYIIRIGKHVVFNVWKRRN